MFKIGAIVSVVCVLGLILTVFQALGVSDGSSTSALPGSIMLLVIGFALSGWGFAALAIRAGSVARGAWLIQKGWKRANRTTDPTPEP